MSYLDTVMFLTGMRLDLCSNDKFILFFNTVDPVYSQRDYSDYPIIVNGFLRTDR